MALDFLGVIFTAKDLASAKISSLEHEFGKLDKTVQATQASFGKGMAVMGAGLATFGAGVAILTPLAFAAKNAAHFQAELVKLGNIADVSGVKLLSLGNDVRKMAADFDFDPTEVVKGMQEIASAGFSARESLEIVDKVLLFQRAAQGSLNVENAAATITAAMKGFGFEISEAAHVTDMLTQATNVTALKFDELALTLGNTAADAKLTNQTFQGTLAVLGALRDTGLTSLRASEKLRIALQHMIDPKAAKMAGLLGISLRDQNGQLRQVEQIVTDLEPKLSKMGQVQKEQALAAIFGKEAMAVYNAVSGATFTIIENGTEKVIKGTAAIREMTKSIHEANGTTLKQFEAFKATFIGAWEAIKANIDSILVSLGIPIMEVLTPLIVGIQKIASGLAKWAQAHPGMMKLVAAIIAFVGGFVMAVGLVVLFKGALMVIGGLLTMVGMSMAALGLIFLKAAAFVAILIGAFYLLKKAFEHNFGGIADFFTAVFDKVKVFFQAIVGLIEGGEISEELNKQLEDMGMGGFVDSILRVWSRVKAFFSGLWEGFMIGFRIAEPALKMFFGAVMSLFESVGGLLGTWITGFDKITGSVDGNVSAMEKWKTIGKVVGVVIGGVLGALVSGFATVASGIVFIIDMFISLKTWVDKIAIALIAAFISPIETIKSAWQAIINWIIGAIDKIANSSIVKWGMEKLGLNVEPMGAMPAMALPGGGMIEAPTAGLGNQALATEAGIKGQQSIAGAVQEAGDKGAGGKEIVVQSNLILDGRVAATAVNRANQRDKLSGGGLK